MNLGALLVMLKLVDDMGFTVSPKRGEPRPPTSTAGVRPDCGIGQKAVFFQNPDRWVCVPKFK